ncbi:MAG TPA: Ada metal-binding domain-containing protein [Pseudorhodoferax sp.]|nr:Ada metal-binding domain-containing protein [Pseudorhodoferax sp.]
MQGRPLGVSDKRTWTLLGRTGQPYESEAPGTLGGHRKGKLYGLLTCRAAAQALARSGYVLHRVFFADEATAIAAGYRPCAVCLPEKYAAWKTRMASAGAISRSAS